MSAPDPSRDQHPRVPCGTYASLDVARKFVLLHQVHKHCDEVIEYYIDPCNWAPEGAWMQDSAVGYFGRQWQSESRVWGAWERRLSADVLGTRDHACRLVTFDEATKSPATRGPAPRVKEVPTCKNYPSIDVALEEHRRAVIEFKFGFAWTQCTLDGAQIRRWDCAGWWAPWQPANNVVSRAMLGGTPARLVPFAERDNSPRTREPR